MLKKSFLTIIFSCFVIISSFSNNPVISKFEKLSAQQLLDTAEYYANNNFNDVALICYSLIINSPVANADFEQQKKVVNQLQHLYEITKTNQQIEQLAIERQIKERTIHYQKIIQFITLIVLIIVSIALLIIFFQKRKLDKAYKELFEKNMKMVSFHISPENHPEKYKKSSLTDELQGELINKILTVMKDSSIICDPEFTLDKLAELVQSNQTYVSQIINTVLNKNFRSFLNEYRILEAQRLFSASDMAKYTIEMVAFQVGFKSRNTFYNAFKDITGINPTFYLKSIQEQHKKSE